MFIVRYSEIGLKGRSARDRMENLLVRNIESGLRTLKLECSVRRGHGRIYLAEDKDREKVSQILGRIMGIKSYSFCVTGKAERLQDLVSKAVELWSEEVSGKRFAIRARRVGQHNFHSVDIMKSVGDAIFPFSKGVDLSTPDIELNIEVRDKTAYYFSEIIPGPGGLPLGSEGKMVALVSGGIDSPVAAWSIMKRGCPVDLVFCSLAPPTDLRDFLNAAESLVSEWSYGYDPFIHIIDGRLLVNVLTDDKKFKVGNITFKRILYLIAQRIAEGSGAHGIVTGESLGQVSSQTPESLHALSRNMDFPVLRPLIGMDKDEITALARKIGTFPESSSGEFCALFSKNPITRPRVEELEDDMSRFDQLDELISSQRIIRGADLKKEISELDGQDLEAEKIPDKAVVIDLRDEDSYSRWHFPGSLNLNIRSLDGYLDGLEERSGTYVFYCMKGLQSAYAASKARDRGLNAYFTDEKRLRNK